MNFGPVGAIIAAKTGDNLGSVKRLLLDLRLLTHCETRGKVAHLRPTYRGLRGSSKLGLLLLLAARRPSIRIEGAEMGLTDCCAPEDVQIMYGAGGERALPGKELTHLPGYKDANLNAQETRLYPATRPTSGVK